MALPYYFRIPFGFSGDRTSIPVTGSNSGPVNFQYGYGEPYSLPRSTDPAALTIPRVSFNQLLYNTTASIQQLQQYGFPYYITAADNGGTAFSYAKNVIVRYDNGTTEENYLSLVDSNTALPTVTTNWLQLRNDPAYLGLAQTFTQIQTFSAAGTPLAINSTNSTANKIRLRDNGTDVGYIGANSSHFFRVSDAAGNFVGGWSNAGHLVPASNNAYDVGTSALLYRALYSTTSYTNSVQANGSGGVALRNSAGGLVAEFGPAGTLNASIFGKLNTAASTTGAAGLNVAPGVAPTSPVNGDIWVTSTGAFARVNGVTQQLDAVSSVAMSALTSGTLGSGVGAVATSGNLGTISSGTVTPLATTNGNFNHYTNNGAHTLAPPAGVCTMIIQILNGASAGAITTSGYTLVEGDAFTTTNGHRFVCWVTRTNDYSILSVKRVP